MDKTPVYPGAIPLDTNILQPQRNIEIALGYFMQAVLGTTTAFDGLAVTQTTVPSMAVQVGPGSIYFLTTTDTLTTGFGSLPVDNANPLVKVGVNNTPTTMATLTAPGTAGQSVNVLVEAQFIEADGSPVVLPFYNAANPAVPYTGPSNTGAPSNTARTNRVSLQYKIGAPAATGSQVTPAPDAGWVGIGVITIANGQSSITNSNISAYAGAPIIDGTHLGRGVRPGRLLNVQVFTSSGTYTPTLGTSAVVVEVQGGGGGGGGCRATSSGTISVGSGGSAGAYGKGYYASGFTGGIVVTVGAGGTGGNGAAGNNGGTSSFGALLSAPGGTGGTTAGPTTPPWVTGVPNSSAATGGTIINASGQAGGASVSVSAGIGFGALGGASPFGPGGGPVSGGVTGAGAQGLGSGGGGTMQPQSLGTLTGGDGAGGVVVVWEYS